jgi:hypothetical protein
MSEFCHEELRCDPGDLRQALAIHTRKITDSCRDKDCVEDLRVCLTASSQALLDRSTNVRVRSAELLYAYIDVEAVAFDRNHYCIDVTFYYRVLADAVIGTARPAALCGLAQFSKRVVLCGEDSSAHIFTSDTRLPGADGASLYTANRPRAVVEVLDPMVLGSKVREGCECREALAQIPSAIQKSFEEELVTTGSGRRLYVTLGQFSIVRLERDAQIIVPVVDYAIPTKSCCDSPECSNEDPCEMFSRIPFPTARFVPRGCDGEDCRNE